jgi:membrane protein required for colicin V production
MNWADWTILIILGLSCLIGLVRGLIKESLSLAVWLAALFIANHFKTPAAQLLAQHIQTPSLREMAAFGGLFVLTLLVGSLINFVIGQIVKMTGLTGTDRMLGMVFGAARGFLIVMAIIIFLPPVIPIDKDSWWHQSVFIPEFIAFEDSAREIFRQMAGVYRSIIG